MTEEQRREEIANAKMFYLAAPVMIPLLEKRMRITLDQLAAQHRAGITNTVALVAEFVVLRDLIRDINQQENIYKTLEGQNVR